jgi:hypothetical protein
MSQLAKDQREKTLEMTEAAADVLRRAQRGEATPQEVAEATSALLGRLSEEHATGDALKGTVVQKDITVGRPLKIKPK